MTDGEFVRRGAHASRLSATKLCTSPTDIVEVRDRVADSLGSLASSAGDRRQVLVELRASGPALSCSADTSIDRFLTVLKRVVAVVAERRKRL